MVRTETSDWTVTEVNLHASRDWDIWVLVVFDDDF